MIFDYTLENFTHYKGSVYKRADITGPLPKHRFLNYLYFFPFEEKITKEQYFQEHRHANEPFGNMELRVKEAEEAFYWLLENKFIEEIENN